MSDGNYICVILEEIRDQNKAVLEAAADMQDKVSRIPIIEASVDELKE